MNCVLNDLIFSELIIESCAADPFPVSQDQTRAGLCIQTSDGIKNAG